MAIVTENISNDIERQLEKKEASTDAIEYISLDAEIPKNELQAASSKGDIKVPDSSLRSWIVCIATAWVFGLYLDFGLVYLKLTQIYNTTENAPVYAGK